MALFFSAIYPGIAAGTQVLHGHVPPAVARFNLQPTGQLPATKGLHLAIGLPLRNQEALTDLIQQLYDPASPNYHQYLTPEQFTEQFGPTEQDYQKVIAFAKRNGLTVTGTSANRVLLDVSGSVADIEKAFQVTMRTYRHPTEARDFFAPDTEPTVDVALPVVDIQGLNDFSRPHPKLVKRGLANAVPQNGSAPDGSGAYFGNDFRNAYVPGTTLTGAGQVVGLVEFDGFYSKDIVA
jgi:subtilase family serine protease